MCFAAAITHVTGDVARPQLTTHTLFVALVSKNMSQYNMQVVIAITICNCSNGNYFEITMNETHIIHVHVLVVVYIVHYHYTCT